MAGVPFITSDVGDRKMLLGVPPAGMLVPPGDPNELSNAIIKLITNPELSKSLVKLGRQRVGSYYWDKLVHSLNQAIEKMDIYG